MFDQLTNQQTYNLLTVLMLICAGVVMVVLFALGMLLVSGGKRDSESDGGELRQ